MSAPRILVVGSYAAGLTMKASRFPTPGETLIGTDFRCLHGGKGSNQAVECARLGAQVSLIACLGDDDYGRSALALYDAEGVDRSRVKSLPGRSTGAGFIMVSGDGENEILLDFGANNAMSAELVGQNRDIFAEADLMLVQLELPVEAVAAAVALANACGTRTVLNPAPFRPLPEECIRGVSILTPNETEAKLLLGLPPTAQATPEEMASALTEHGIAASVITLGGRGALVTEDGKSQHIAPFPVQTVDTTGAGDTFTAALGVAVAEGAALAEAAVFASAAAALSTTKYGVVEAMPSRSEINAYLRTVV